MKKTMLVLAVYVMVAMITAPAFATLETFSYNSSSTPVQLYGLGYWQNGGQTGQIQVVENQLIIRGGDGARKTDSASLAWGLTGTVFVEFKVKKDAMVDGGNSWSIRINDQAGVNLARVYGGPYSLRGRDGKRRRNWRDSTFHKWGVGHGWNDHRHCGKHRRWSFLQRFIAGHSFTLRRRSGRRISAGADEQYWHHWRHHPI